VDADRHKQTRLRDSLFDLGAQEDEARWSAVPTEESSRGFLHDQADEQTGVRRTVASV